MVKVSEGEHSIRSVLQVNVRLSEGGAAGVARSLSRQLEAAGVHSPIAYGYATGGKSSPLEAEYGGVRITPALIAAANRVAFPLLGDETPLRYPANWRRFEEAVERADVVHLHAIHSHVARVESILETIARAKKPVVWTMHDQWLMTGRCAQPATCRRWEQGCFRCPTLSAYPAATIDRARVHWPRRRRMLEDLREQVPVQLVACAGWLAREAASAGLGPVLTITNSVDGGFHDAVAAGRRPSGARGKTRLLFICRDLRDEQKVHWPTLRAIAAMPHVELTIVGDNAPQRIERAVHLPSSGDREALARLMLSHDELVFLSGVDYYPLTLAEALTAGMIVRAIDSEAAREFSPNRNVHIYRDREELVGGVGTIPAGWISPGVDLDSFAPGRMVRDYLSAYEQVGGKSA